MATRLELVFKNSSGEKIQYNYNYADPDVGSTTVKALMNGMIANGEIFEKVPVSIVSATLVTTEETTLNLG